MSTLEVFIYEATRQVFDDRYPVDFQPIAESTQLEFDPIPDLSTAFAEGHCYTLVEGGEQPSYRLEVPGGEFFIKLFENGRARRFVRTPETKAADGVVLVSMAQYAESGVRALPLDGGKVIELLPDPLAEVRPKHKVKPPAKARPEPKARPAPSPLPPPRLVVEFGPAPTGPPVKRTQMSFLDDLEVAG